MFMAFSLNEFDLWLPNSELSEGCAEIVDGHLEIKLR